METIKLKTHINSDGILTIELPSQFKNTETEILIVLQTISPPQAVDAMGYPIGYFEETFGILADDPIERGDQGEFEIREEIE
jgi:hypothetical protein